jgi:hypothetical protein
MESAAGVVFERGKLHKNAKALADPRAEPSPSFGLRREARYKSCGNVKA